MGRQESGETVACKGWDRFRNIKWMPVLVAFLLLVNMLLTCFDLSRSVKVRQRLDWWHRMTDDALSAADVHLRSWHAFQLFPREALRKRHRSSVRRAETFLALVQLTPSLSLGLIPAAATQIFLLRRCLLFMQHLTLINPRLGHRYVRWSFAVVAGLSILIAFVSGTLGQAMVVKLGSQAEVTLRSPHGVR